MVAEQEQDAIPPISPSRLEAFSDGVIAIAATLLILEVARPALDEPIGHWLVAEWPQFTAYAISFLTIGILWVNHHGMFHVVERVDRPLLFLNLGLLLTIAFLPLPTSVAGDRIGGPDATAAAVMFTITLGAGAVWLMLMWLYLIRHRHLLVPAARGRSGAALRRSLIGPIGYVVAIGLALFSPVAALGLTAALALFYAWTPSHLRVRPPT